MEKDLIGYGGIESIDTEVACSTYESLSSLHLCENITQFNEDIREIEYRSDSDIVDNCFMHSLGYNVTQNQRDFDKLSDLMINEEQERVYESFWSVSNVEDVLEVIKLEDLTEEMKFYTSLKNHLENSYTKWNEDNIHEEILAYSLFYNLDRGKGLFKYNTVYKKVKEIVDVGLPARHALEVVFNP
jgi:hypothetical protein